MYKPSNLFLLHAFILIVLSLAQPAEKVLAQEAGAGDPGPQIMTSGSTDEPVIILREWLGELDTSDHLWMEIYVDGRVVRHVPEYMKEAGTWIGQLSSDEFDRLTQSLAATGILEMDTAATARNVQSGEPDLTYSSDPSLVEIEVRYVTNLARSEAGSTSSTSKKLTWLGLRRDARKYPDNTAIQGLSSAYKQLSSVAQHAVKQGEIAHSKEGRQ